MAQIGDSIVIVSRFPTGRLRISRVVYFTNLQRTDSREIPVGVVGEVTLSGLRGVGTAFRPSFSTDELALMGPLMRDILTHPSDVLWPEFLEIFKTREPGAALDLFAQRHASSLSVLAPTPLDVPRQWLLERDNTRLQEIVRDRIKVILTDEYFKFLFPPRGDGQTVDDPTVEERVAKLAA
jgi:hypothetical protein